MPVVDERHGEQGGGGAAQERLIQTRQPQRGQVCAKTQRGIQQETPEARRDDGRQHIGQDQERAQSGVAAAHRRQQRGGGQGQAEGNRQKESQPEQVVEKGAVEIVVGDQGLKIRQPDKGGRPHA
jgi:hypothetical protein